MLITLIRTFISYLMVLFVIRIMGKSELSKMSPFQLVVIFMIAELAAIPIESPSASLINGITGIFTLLFLQVSISLLSIKSEGFKNFMNGTPSILVSKGSINLKELAKQRISTNDLMEQLRIGGTPSLSDVEYAIMESNGQLSIIPKSDSKPLTPKDMSMNKPPEALPLTLIADGTLYYKNLAPLGMNENILKSDLLGMGIVDYKEVFFAFCDADSKLHVFRADEAGKTALEVSK